MLLKGAAQRRVASHARADVLAFLADPVTQAAVSDGRLIGSEVVTGVETFAAGELELLHPLVDFPSYCWEWAPSMWVEAAELTLALGREMLGSGWILKDATPHNVLFRGVRPLFVDVLSFERWGGRAVWPAYAQFVRTFLLPMLAHSRLGWPLSGSLMRRDGLEPEEVYAALGWRGRLSGVGLRVVTLPKWLGGRSVPKRLNPHIGGTTYGKAGAIPLGTDEIQADIVRSTMQGLARQMREVAPEGQRSKWSEYVESASHYRGEDHAAKQEFVERVLQTERPGWVLDVGANTGTYSMIAAGSGAEVVAIDSDLRSVERLAREVKKSGSAAVQVLPLCVDLAQPTPAVGWENRESLSFLERAEGRFDMVMMLAVIHHLLLTSQIPLKEIAALCARLTRRGVIVEWVPGGDPRFAELVRGREALYAGLTEEAFRAAMAAHFEVREEKRLGNGRVLLHLRRRG